MTQRRDLVLTPPLLVPGPHLERADTDWLGADAARQVRIQPATTNLPKPATPLIGRAAEVAAIADLVHANRLVTLVGPAGSGKTRLAIAVASELAAGYRDGAHFGALQDARDRPGVAAAVAAAVGIRERPDAELEASVEAYFHAREALIVLDNYEHVVFAAPLVMRLLEAAPGVRVLVTSRAPLRLSGEHEHVVPPLALPAADDDFDVDELQEIESVALFVERAASVSEGFELDATNAAAIATIVRRVDGLPLSVELAAAQVRVLPPTAILDRLERRLPVLGGGRRDAPARQQTQRATLDWSFDLLDEPERLLLTRLSVFAGGWTIEAAERVCDPDQDLGIDVYTGLTSLVENNLVRALPDSEDEPRFDLLKVMREYASERLASRADREATAESHARWILDLVQAAEPELVKKDVRAWQFRLKREADNLRAALQWAIDRGETEVAQDMVAACVQFWLYWGLVREGCASTEAALGLEPDAAGDRSRADALRALGTLRLLQHRPTEALTRFEEALALQRVVGDARSIAIALEDVIFAVTDLGDLDRMRRHCVERWEVYPEPIFAEQPWDLETCLIYQEYFYFGIGSYERAISEWEMQHEWIKTTDLVVFAAHSEANLAWMRFMGGHLEESAAASRDAIRTFHELGYIGLIAYQFDVLASAEAGLGNAERAARLAAAARRVHEELGSRGTRFPAHVEDPRARLPELLSAAALATAAEEGAAMTLDETVMYALSKRGRVPRSGRSKRRDPNSLTPRERDVLQLVVEGRADAEIAEALFITPKTASTHVSNIKSKLGAESRVEIATIAIRTGLTANA